MWTIDRIKLDNFMSFKEQEYSFKQGIPVLVQGINGTDDSAESNGSGKSALEEAVNYSLTGNSIRKIRDIKLINYDANVACLELQLSNSLTKDCLLIKRQLSRVESGKLQIFINNIDQKDKFSGITEGNKFIIQLLGVSIEDLQNYFIISKEKYTSFFSSSDVKKKELIGRFSNADKILGVEDLVEIDIKKLTDEKDALVKQVVQIESKKEVYDEQLLQFDATVMSEKLQKEIDGINTLIEEKKQILEELENEIEEIEESIAIKTSEIKTLDTQIKENQDILIEFQDVDRQKEIDIIAKRKESFSKNLLESKQQKKEFNTSLDEFVVFLRDVQNNLAGLIKCPKCFYEFLLDEEVDVQELKSTVPEIEKNIKDLKECIEEVNKNQLSFQLKIDDFDDKLISIKNEIQEDIDKKAIISKRVNELKGKKETTLQFIKRSEKSIEDMKSDIENNNKKIVSLTEDIEVIKNKEYDDQKAVIEVKIQDLSVERIVLQEAISTKEEEIQKLNLWILNFKKFYSYLANKSLSIIEGYANLYLQKMETNLQMKIEGYKTNANGKMKENITPAILRNGILEGEFNQFSGGEKAKLDFSLVLTNQQLINLNSPSGGLDLLWIDEILESVDGKGIRCLLNSLKEVNKTILLTTHVAHDKVNENTLTVEKINGVSKILI